MIKKCKFILRMRFIKQRTYISHLSWLNHFPLCMPCCNCHLATVIGYYCPLTFTIRSTIGSWMTQYVQVVVTSRLPVNIPVPAIEISSFGIPFSTDSARWLVTLPLLSKINSPNIRILIIWRPYQRSMWFSNVYMSRTWTLFNRNLKWKRFRRMMFLWKMKRMKE